jgi:hypothetical protein
VPKKLLLREHLSTPELLKRYRNASNVRIRGWEYLKQMEYTLKVPRPKHEESSDQEQQEWKKNWI